MSDILQKQGRQNVLGISVPSLFCAPSSEASMLPGFLMVLWSRLQLPSQSLHPYDLFRKKSVPLTCHQESCWTRYSPLLSPFFPPARLSPSSHLLCFFWTHPINFRVSQFLGFTESFVSSVEVFCSGLLEFGKMMALCISSSFCIRSVVFIEAFSGMC